MKFKFIKATFLVLALAFSNLAISCQAQIKPQEKAQIKFQDTEIFKIDWSKISPASYFDAQIVRWTDGDTPVVRVIKTYENSVETIGSTLNIRIFAIDTPELRVPNQEASAFEKARAAESSHYARQLLSPGTKVRIVYPSGVRSLSYNRVVAALFFNKENKNDYQFNYANHLIRAGLTFPSNVDTFSSILILNKKFIISHLLLAYANSFLYARQNKLGFFKEHISSEEPFQGVQKVYQLRGVPSHSQYLKSSNKSIYNFEAELTKLYAETE